LAWYGYWPHAGRLHRCRRRWQPRDTCVADSYLPTYQDTCTADAYPQSYSHACSGQTTQQGRYPGPCPGRQPVRRASRAEREIAIYLPPSYSSSNKRYPVIYYLAGYDEDLNDSYILLALMKKMLEAGTVKEMMFVFVSGQNPLGGSFYVNSPVSGNWEDFIISNMAPMTHIVGYQKAANSFHNN
jgi:hypothetical protein